MGEAATDQRLCLSYGMGLTRIFHAYGIPLEGEASKEILHIDTYGEKSLHRMGCKRVASRWVRRESGQEPNEEDEIRAAEAGSSGPAS